MKNTVLFLFLVIVFWGISSCDSSSSEKETSTDVTSETTTSETPTPTSKTSTSKYCYGIDISQYQGNEVDFLNKNTDTLTFIICKATEGRTYTDPYFNRNWSTISEKGFVKGAYHFYRSIDAPEKQVANYLKAISNLDSQDLPPIVDFEGGGIDQSQSTVLIQSNLIEFLKLVEEKINRKPMIYTDNPTGDKYLNAPEFADYALWIADYDEKTSPVLPIIWRDKTWNFWQKSSSYKIDSRKNDFDVFNGTQEQLSSFIENY